MHKSNSDGRTGADEPPLVTIITPTYNRARFLGETIDSVLAQDYPRLEYLVLDDGSTDDTLGLLAKYSETYGDRFRWSSHANVGQARTVNRGFTMARGELIGLVSSDDPLPPGIVGQVAEVLRARPEVLVAYPDIDYIDDDGIILGHYDEIDYSYRDMVRWHECAPSAGALFRRSIFDRIGGWDPSFRCVPDYDFWLRAGLLGPFQRVPGVRARWRLHDGSISMGERGKAMAREHVRVIENLYARDDLPEDVRAIRGEAFRTAYITAGIVVHDDPGAPGHRFFITSRMSKRHSLSDTMAEPRSNNPQAVIYWLHRETGNRDQLIHMLRGEVAQRDEIIDRLRAVATGQETTIATWRDLTSVQEETIESLQDQAARQCQMIDQLREDALAREAATAQLQGEIRDREDKIAKPRNEVRIHDSTCDGPFMPRPEVSDE